MIQINFHARKEHSNYLRKFVRHFEGKPMHLGINATTNHVYHQNFVGPVMVTTPRSLPPYKQSFPLPTPYFTLFYEQCFNEPHHQQFHFNPMIMLKILLIFYGFYLLGDVQKWDFSNPEHYIFKVFPGPLEGLKNIFLSAAWLQKFF